MKKVIGLCLIILASFIVNTVIANAAQNIILTNANPDTTIFAGTTVFKVMARQEQTM